MTGGPSTGHLDDTSSFPLDAKNEHHAPRTRFHQKRGLVSRLRRKIRAVNPQCDGGQNFGIDCGVLRRSPSTPDDLPGSSPPSAPSLSGGAIGGIVACAVLSILLILLGVFIWHRREKNQASSSTINIDDGDAEISKAEDSFGTGPVVHHTPSLPALPPLRIPSPSNSVMVSVSPIESDSEAGEGGIFTFSSEDSRTLVPQSNYTERDRGTGTESVYMVRPSKLVGQGLGKVKREREPRVAPSLLYPPVMTFDGDPGGWRQSLRPLPKPRITLSNGYQYRTSLPNLQNVRMHVEGRLQDFGPAAGPESFFTVPNDDDGLLPPDYYQATQPFPDPVSVPISPSSPGPLLSP